MVAVGQKLLGIGVYDLTEMSRLLHVSPAKLGRWTTSGKTKEALVPPTSGRIFSFHDLVSLWVVRELSRRGVPLDEIRIGVKTLGQEFATPRPLAHERALGALATSGRAFFAHLDEWVDAGKGGQGAFQAVVLPTLRRLEFDGVGMASVWRPRDLVWLNPKVQAGAPCVDHRRIPTGTIFDLVERGEDPADIAADYELEPEEVRAAINFERELVDAGLAAA
jgi:uncharacterized protein (DUF433 family)/DNA-binding transcriptional MerR regulator